MNTKERNTFSDKFGVFMAAVASAVGLGSIWRFPYLLGEHGGAAFLVVYIFFMLIIGFPIMLCEFVIGRRGQGNAFRSFRQLSPKSPWCIVGLMNIVAALVILSFYSTISGWAIEYVVYSARNIFSPVIELADHAQVFENFTSGKVMPLVWMSVSLLLTASIVLLGIQKGIEKYTKSLMPILFLFLVILAVEGLTLPGSMEGVKFLFYPDFSKLDADAVMAALGQAAFSLGIGSGIMITFGSYIKKDINLPKTAFSVVTVDILMAVLAAVAIFPSVFAFGMQPEQGPGLVYVIYPAIFEQISGGAVFSLLFFIMLIVAAITSTITMLEVAVAFFMEELKLNRFKATIISAVIPWILSIFTTLSFGPLRHVKIFSLSIFESSDFFASNILMPLGVLFVAVFIGWFYNKKYTKDEITNQGKISSMLFPVFIFIIRFIVPLAILFIFLKEMGMEGFGLL